MTVSAVIPARDEEQSIGLVVGELFSELNDDDTPIVDEVVVCDNGSCDHTAARAQDAGARVVVERRPGYGRACLCALDALKSNPPHIVVFIDGDYAFETAAIRTLLDRLVDHADLVIGSRQLGRVDPGALTGSQVFGNWLATTLIRILWRCEVTDLGPFRAIRWPVLESLDMQNERYGWTVEMQVKTIQRGYRIAEVPVNTRCRLGESKISGTWRGVVGAGLGILGMIFKLRLQRGKTR